MSGGHLDDLAIILSFPNDPSEIGLTGEQFQNAGNHILWVVDGLPFPNPVREGLPTNRPKKCRYKNDK